MFPCTNCGACCRRVDKAVEVLGGAADFPYQWDESGKCEKLNGKNECEVYENRPLMCNIDKVIEIFGLDKKSFYELNIKACNTMMAEHGISDFFKIKL